MVETKRMNTIRDIYLLPGETVLLKLRPSWKANIRHFFLASSLTLIAFHLWGLRDNPATSTLNRGTVDILTSLALLVSGNLMIVWLIGKLATPVILTNYRIVRNPDLRERLESIAYGDIRDLRAEERSGLMKGIWNIYIETKDGRKIQINGLKDAKAGYELIQKSIERQDLPTSGDFPEKPAYMRKLHTFFKDFIADNLTPGETLITRSPTKREHMRRTAFMFLLIFACVAVGAGNFNSLIMAEPFMTTAMLFLAIHTSYLLILVHERSPREYAITSHRLMKRGGIVIEHYPYTMIKNTRITATNPGGKKEIYIKVMGLENEVLLGRIKKTEGFYNALTGQINLSAGKDANYFPTAEGLPPEEKILLKKRQSSRPYLVVTGSSILLFLILAYTLFGGVYPSGDSASFILCMILMMNFLVFYCAVFDYFSKTYTLTQERIVKSTGLARVRLENIPYKEITNTSIRKGILGTGNITIETAKGEMIKLENLENPHEFQNLIQERMVKKNVNSTRHKDI